MSLVVNEWDSDNPKPTESAIRNVEQLLDIKLPPAYLQFMNKWNGGYFPDEYQIPIKDNFPEELGYYLGEGFWGISAISGISSDMSNSSGIVYSASSAHEWGIPKKVIAFDGDGHTWIAFDYRDEYLEEPKIVFIESDKCICFAVANSFSEFLDILIPSHQIYDKDGNIIYSR